MEDIEKFKKQLKWDIDLSKTNYQIDALQNKLLQFYLRADSKFRKAFYQNYTQDFIQFLKDKARLREPVKLTTMGTTRGGKSYSMITLAILHSVYNGKLFNVNYICGNVQEYIEKLRTMEEKELINSFFLMDEEKTAIYGSGSFAKKTKTQDVANITAINNISTCFINPVQWADSKAMYGLRAWGKCFQTKSCRFMLYNLQEGGKGGTLPLGCVYIPIFTEFAPKPYSTELEKNYLKKKMEVVRAEIRGEGDILQEIKKKSAKAFMNDKQFLSLKKKNEKLTYIKVKLGSEWTTKECEEICYITQMLSNGINLD